MSGEDLRFAMQHPSTTTIVTMPKFTQIKEIYFQSNAGLHSHIARMREDFRDAYIGEQLQTIIRTKTRSAIVAETPEPFTIRGHGPDRINIDEFNFIRQDEDLWLSALLPMTLTKRVDISIASTPWSKGSVYHKMCTSKEFDIFHGNDFNEHNHQYFRRWDQVIQPKGPLLRSQVDLMRKQYKGDPWRWKREMEQAFIDDETSFLPSSLIIKCQNSELSFTPFEASPHGMFFIGWDLGKTVDPACVTVVQLDEDVRRLVHCKVFKLGVPHTTVMGYIKSICDRWDYVTSVLYDRTGTKGVEEQIERLGFPRLEGVWFSKPSKHGMATFFKDLMMSKRDEDRELLTKDARRKFEMPFDMDVQGEYNVVQWEQSPGSEHYSFSHPKGSHDDRFWATAICLKGTASFGTSQMEVETGRVNR